MLFVNKEEVLLFIDQELEVDRILQVPLRDFDPIPDVITPHQSIFAIKFVKKPLVFDLKG